MAGWHSVVMTVWVRCLALVVAIASAAPQRRRLPHTSPEWTIYDPFEYSSIDEFLKEYPPSRITTYQYAWIYVPSPEEEIEPGNVKRLKREWDALDAKGKATESALLQLALKNRVLSGKWMIYRDRATIDQAWNPIAREVAAGKLGVAAKAGPPGPDSRMTSDTRSCVGVAVLARNEDEERHLHLHGQLRERHRDTRASTGPDPAGVHRAPRVQAGRIHACGHLSRQQVGHTRGPVRRISRRGNDPFPGIKRLVPVGTETCDPVGKPRLSDS